MISEGTLRFVFARVYFPCDHKISVGTYAKSINVCVSKSSSTQYACKGHFANTLWQWHHRRYRVRWRSTRKHTHFEWQTFFIGLSLVHANAAVQLVVQTYFFILCVIISVQLNSIHSQISIHNAGLVCIFAVHLRQRYKCSSIHRPVLNGRNIGDLNFTLHHRLAHRIF